MASLKHNGEEKARVAFRKTDSEGTTTTRILSLGTKGWMLRRVDVVFPDGRRVKGGWKRVRKYEDADKTVAALRSLYSKEGWEEVTA